MIVFIVHVFDIFVLETKSDPPVSTYIDSLRSGSISFQFVKSKAGKPHVLRPSRRMKPAEYEAESLRM
jgi:hypothetical protein